jgi:hypothetical protein
MVQVSSKRLRCSASRVAVGARVAVRSRVAHDLGQGVLGDASIGRMGNLARLDFSAALRNLATGALSSLQDFVLAVALQVPGGVLLSQCVGFFGRVRITTARLS